MVAGVPALMKNFLDEPGFRTSVLPMETDSSEPGSSVQVQLPRPTNALLESGAPEAAKLVMLGIIVLILGCLLAFIFRLRYLSRHPHREADDLETMVRSESGDDDV